MSSLFCGAFEALLPHSASKAQGPSRIQLSRGRGSHRSSRYTPSLSKHVELNAGCDGVPQM